MTEAVATSHHQLLAYKDEYEVARLLVGPEARAAVAEVGGADATVHWKLHPPLLRSLGMKRKLSIRAGIGSPMMRLLAAGKRVRGTKLDPFGYAEVRRVERALIREYEAAMASVLDRLAAGTIELDEAIRIAELPQAVRGYEHRKLDRAETCRAELARVVS